MLSKPLQFLNSQHLIVQQLSDNTITVDEYYTINDFPFEEVFTKILHMRYCGNHETAYLSDFGTFDIETSTYLMSIIDNEPIYNAFMYHWQYC